MSVCKDLDALSSAELKRLLTREGVSFWASCCIGSKKLILFFTQLTASCAAEALS